MKAGMLPQPQTVNIPAPVSAIWLNGLRILLLLAMALTARFDWFYVRAEGWDTPPLIPLLAVNEVPLAVALTLIAKKGAQNRIAWAAGLAFATALAATLLTPFLLLGAKFAIWDTRDVYRNLVELRKLLPVAFLLAVSLTIFSWPCGKRRRSRFFAGFATLLIYFIPAFSTLSYLTLVGSGARKQDNAWSSASDQAFHVLTSITACLIRHQFLHPDAGLPASLSDVPPDWDCDMYYLKPQPVEGYVLTYSPWVDSATGRVTKFQLTAVPYTKSRNGASYVPLMIDSRGIFFSDRLWPEGNNPRFIQTSSGSDLIRVQKLAQDFIQKHAGHAPASYSDLLHAEKEHQERYGAALRGTGPYTFHYFGPQPEEPGHYAIAATCQRYGHDCIRSYFLDADGVTHATPEPREATAVDPPALPCEVEYQNCGDVQWPPASLPTEHEISAASLQHTLSSTPLWFPPKAPKTLSEEPEHDRFAHFTKAQYAMLALTGCLIRHQSLHPEQGFPDSLQKIAPDWNCDPEFLGSDPLPAYAFSYEPKWNPANIAVDFRLTAIPRTKLLYPCDPMMSDRRGVIFVFSGWSMWPNVVPQINAFSDVSNSHLLVVKNDLEYFTKKHNSVPPASLSVLVNQPRGLQPFELADANALTLIEKPFSLQYFPPSSVHPNRFAISATCQSYAEGCIRSYLLDSDGIIHGTPEPRPARMSDPAIPNCESYGSNCEADVDWTMPVLNEPPTANPTPH
jgi:hypothetical protein